MNDCITLNSNTQPMRAHITDVKLDRYTSTDNFVGESEITVTITLEEYRKLVKAVAVKDYEVDKYRIENANLQNTITRLEQKITKLLTEDTEEGE